MAFAGKIAQTHNNKTKSLTFIKYETQKNDRNTNL